MVLTGLDRIHRGEYPLKDLKYGLLCHQASVTRDLIHAKFVLHYLVGKDLVCLFSPQHGLYAEKQDNMKESPDRLDEDLGIPVYSLYGERREPTREQMGAIDCLIVDLQDVGTRVYTYVWTLFLALKVAEDTGTMVMVLDRPNPIGGEIVEGNRLSPRFHSFVGMASIPMRHGMTLGELAIYFKERWYRDLRLHVVEMNGWRRRMYFTHTGLPWVLPSPNMPTLDTAMVYPGQVLLEGTNLSEGRGTTRPFEIFGAPFVRPWVVEGTMKDSGLHGFVLRRQVFEPTSNKWQGERCLGFQIHVLDPQVFRPYLFTLSLLSTMKREFPESFDYIDPPYEYEFIKKPIDLLIGDGKVREAIDRGASTEELRQLVSGDELEFREEREAYLIYRD